jgi:hypothetical protein
MRGEQCEACLDGFWGPACQPCVCSTGVCFDGKEGDGECQCTAEDHLCQCSVDWLAVSAHDTANTSHGWAYDWRATYNETGALQERVVDVLMNASDLWARIEAHPAHETANMSISVGGGASLPFDASSPTFALLVGMTSALLTVTESDRGVRCPEHMAVRLELHRPRSSDLSIGEVALSVYTEAVAEDARTLEFARALSAKTSSTTCPYLSCLSASVSNEEAFVRIDAKMAHALTCELAPHACANSSQLLLGQTLGASGVARETVVRAEERSGAKGFLDVTVSAAPHRALSPSPSDRLL